MASIYRRGNKFWVSYYVDSKQIKESLGTSNERVARSKLKKLEYELALGELHVASKLPLSVILEAFCKELMSTRTYKSYKNDFSRLRVFFGPVCKILEPGIPGVKRHHKRRSRCVDKYAGKHVKAQLLEDITAQVINRFIAARIQKDCWSAKTANLMRQTLHRLFSYAIKHHSFCSRDRRYPNPADGTERKRKPAHQIRFLKLDEIDVQLQVLTEHPVNHIGLSAGRDESWTIWIRDKDTFRS
ncbi:hypothetical protein ACFL6U_08920 [Planctomycetota bacterium]